MLTSPTEALPTVAEDVALAVDPAETAELLAVPEVAFDALAELTPLEAVDETDAAPPMAPPPNDTFNALRVSAVGPWLQLSSQICPGGATNTPGPPVAPSFIRELFRSFNALTPCSLHSGPHSCFGGATFTLTAPSLPSPPIHSIPHRQAEGQR